MKDEYDFSGGKRGPVVTKPIPQPLRDVALRANADWWRINREREKEWEEKKSRGEIPEGHGWAGVGSLPEFIAQALWSALLEGAPEFDEAAAWKQIGVFEATCDKSFRQIAMNMARWQHSQAQPVIAAFKVKCEYLEKELRCTPEISLQEENARLREENERLRADLERAAPSGPPSTLSQLEAQRDNLSKALAYAKNKFTESFRGSTSDVEDLLAEIEKLERGEA